MMSARALRSEPGVGGDPLAAIRARGRIALTCRAIEGTTRRVRVFEEGALRLRFPREAPDRLDAVLVNVAGGMAGGDAFDISAELGAGARLVLTSAAAEKVYRALGAATRADVRLTLGQGARLVFVPQETILFDDARLTRRFEIDMAADARLALCDLTILGRAAMGEDVHTLAWTDQWRLRRDGRLIWADATRLHGDATALLAPDALGGGARAFGTLVYAAPDAEACIEPLRAALAEAPECEAAATVFDDLIVARFIARDGHRARAALARALCLLPDAAPPRSWAT